MCNDHPINPIQCIIPPHMLDVLEMRGDNAIAKMVRDMRDDDQKMRQQRQNMMGSRMIKQKTLKQGQGQFGFVTPASSASSTKTKLNRTIYDGGNKASLPGKIVRKEGSKPSDDPIVNEAYDGAGDVYALYKSEYKRSSLDGEGMSLKQTVHHRRDYNNAFWNGEQMVYGDGDGAIFTKFTELSVLGHEMTHGVVQFSGGLIYEGQSGALNESIADVFGSLTVQRKLKQTACDASWLVGEGILGANINGLALRSMKAPGTAYNDDTLGQDPQPYHMDYYVDTSSDNGGVHINSGIPNHAFYLFAQYIGGNAWEIPGRIWYQALQSLNNPMATFNQWAEQTMDTSIQIHGTGTWETGMLRRAWKLVGIDV